MQIRKPIRDYLDAPDLLREISMASLEAWASEVSYPAIIYRLMAMKVVQEEPTDNGRQIITNALAYSPNPNQLSKELYELALASESSEEEEISIVGSEIVSESRHKDVSTPDLVKPLEGSANDNRAIGNDNTVTSGVEDDLSEGADYTAKDLHLSDGLTSFSEWLLSLENTNSEDEGELENSDFASEALAGLLVKQGHTDKALQMYKQLALIYPEKSTYFAAQIQNLRGS